MSAELLTRQDALQALETRMTRITVNGLFNIMAGRFSSFPDDYLVLDVETTGVVPKHDLVWQMGHCLVKGRKPIDRGGVLLDWTRHPAIDQAWLRQRLLDTKRHVEQDRDGRPTGKTYHINYDLMAEAGVEPEPVLRSYRDWCEEVRQAGMFFVAHNGYHFDAAFLEMHFDRWLQDPWLFNDWELFDTGMVEKAGQSATVPWPGETVRAFSQKVYQQRLKGVKWSLDQHCVPKYGLAEKNGLDMSQAHDAGFDCYLTHLLFEEFRNQAEAGG